MNKSDWKCPCHGKQVVEKRRMREDNQGRRKYAGTYFSCPQYSECGYYVSGTFQVPLTDDAGIALNRQKKD